MLINLLLILGTLAVVGSWFVAVRILRSDKFADLSSPVTTDRTDVLAGSAL